MATDSKNTSPQPAPVQEPVGEVNRYGLDSHGRKWHGIYWYDPNVDVPHGTKLYTSSQPAQQEPVAIVDDSGVIVVCSYKYKPGDKLYTSPPAQKECEKCSHKND